MSFVQQLIELVSQSPGSIIYHIITLLAIQATLGLALWQWRREGDDLLARRLIWATGGILFTRLILLFAISLITSPVEGLTILPPLEQAVNSITILLIIWGLAPQHPNFPRLGDIILLVVLLFVGIMYASFAQAWANQVALSPELGNYNNSPQSTVWGIFQMATLLLGIGLISVARQRLWLFRLAILGVMLLFHIIHFWDTGSITASDTHIAHWIRLGNLIAFPMLTLFTYRYNLSHLLARRSDSQAVAGQTAHQLQLSQNLIHSFDIGQRVQNALEMSQELIEARFVAIATTALDSPQTLQLQSHYYQSEEEAGPPRRQNWALRLSDWPAFRLAMQQRQRVELIPDGLGARQLHDLYRELGLRQLGSLLIEPLLVEGDEIGVFLLAGARDKARWSMAEKTFTGSVAALLAQAIFNARRHERVLREKSSITIADQDAVSGRIIALEQERDEAQSELESLQMRLQHAEKRLREEQERAHQLAETVTQMEQFNVDERVERLEEEIELLRESLLDAEETLALASSEDHNLSTEWVMLTITRYSGALEEAQLHIQKLESELAALEQGDFQETIIELVQEVGTPLTSLAGYTDLLLNKSMGELNHKQVGLLRRMKANIDNMEQLVDKLRDLTQADSVRPFNAPSINIEQTIEATIGAVSSLLQQKNLRVDLKIEPDLPDLQMNETALRQIILYLLNNACQSSPEDSHLLIRAHADVLPSSDNQQNGQDGTLNFLHLSIRDSDPYLNPQLNALALASYHTDEEVESDVELNPILTQAVSKLAAHGGRLWVDNQTGQGNTFSMLLPVHEQPSTDDQHNGAHR